jgi:hypothetical protein
LVGHTPASTNSSVAAPRNPSSSHSWAQQLSRARWIAPAKIAGPATTTSSPDSSAWSINASQGLYRRVLLRLLAVSVNRERECGCRRESSIAPPVESASAGNLNSWCGCGCSWASVEIVRALVVLDCGLGRFELLIGRRAPSPNH